MMKKSILLFVIVLQILFVQQSFAQQKKLTILYTNELHAHLGVEVVLEQKATLCV